MEPVVAKLSTRGENLNILAISITKSYFVATKRFRLTLTHCFIIKIPNKHKFQEIVFNNSSDMIIL